MKKDPARSLLTRTTDIHSLPFAESMTLLHPERVILSFGKGCGTLDFGALCYLHRSDDTRGANKGRRVDPASQRGARVDHVRKVIESVVREARAGGTRLSSLRCTYGAYLRFMDWCDLNGRHDATCDESSLRQAMKAYVAYLRERIMNGTLGRNPAAAYQSQAIAVLQRVTGFDDLGIGINLISKDKRLVEPTLPPDETVVGKVLAWCECLVEGFTDLVVNHKPYPFSLRVCDYLGECDNRLWVFPTIPWAVTRRRVAVSQGRHIDFANGRIRTPEEVSRLTKRHPAKLRFDNLRMHQLLAAATADPLHHSRIERGMLAMKGYLMLLLASSGQPLSVVATLPWSPELDDEVVRKNVTRQQFRNIKYRGGGMEVTFEIGVNHTRLLRQYLDLRAFLLRGRTCDDLFFSLGPNEQGEYPQPIGGSFAVQSIYRTLRTLDPALPTVNPREFRASKQDFLIRTSDPATAAVAMQHSEETAAQYYSNGSPTTGKVEVSAFWKALESKVNVLSKGDHLPGSEDRVSGTCGAPQKPKPITDNAPVTPDCKLPEGCYFCEHFHAHADEKDTHKLLSARLCIRRRASRVGTHEEYESNYAPVLKRIDFILERIRQLRPEMVADIEHTVEEDGSLTPYWSAKMRAYLEIERLQ
ncbi:hypothetical protein [Paraburkholderia caledonica]|uniref:hypothetical protein n=1 Tax=Paraburkholderia caledonica TaxID=134536 RepID=UPI000B489E46|nr:hypothetical protein BWU74_32280 [Burkholderia sp. Bk]